MLKTYYLAKLFRKLKLSSFYKCKFDKTARSSSGSSFCKVQVGRYSYIGAGCHITDAFIGNFCSIGGGCGIGGGMHPMDYVSTSPVFLKGRNILHKHFMEFPYMPSEKVHIGNDVWIGEGVYVKSGVSIGNGAIIGAHAVVTHDVEPYAVVAGVPAREIRKRFNEETVAKIQCSEWWNWPEDKLIKFGSFFNDPESFVNNLEQENG